MTRYFELFGGIAGSAVAAGWLIVAGVSCGTSDASEGTPAPGADGGVVAEAGSVVDPFCRTRPSLSFCEDFDEADLPGRFSSIEGDRAILSREANADAPSSPNVLVVAPTPSSPNARLAISADMGVKYNLFFLVNVEPGHGRVELASLDDGTYRLDLGLEEDDRWYIEERSGSVDGGTPESRTLVTDVRPEIGTFASVRLDVYVDGDGRGHLRFRSGDDVVFENEPLTFGDGKDKLFPRLYVGARLRGDRAARLMFDSVTLGEE